MLEFDVYIETDVAGVGITVELKTLTVAVGVSRLGIDIVGVLHDCHRLRPITDTVKPFTYLVFSRRLLGNV